MSLALTSVLAGCAAFIVTMEGLHRGSLRLLWLGRVLAVFAILTGLAVIAQ